MVKVTGYALRERTDGTKFLVLEISGGLEFIQSAETGKFYAAVRKTNIPATFSEEQAKMIVGTEMDGEIVRIQTDPYTWVNKRSGEVMTLQHTYSYQPPGSMHLIGQTQVNDVQVAVD